MAFLWGKSTKETEDERAASAAIDEVLRVMAAIERGEVGVRASAEGASGRSADLIAGVNRMLDGIQRPVERAAGAMQQYARGELPAVIDERAEGLWGQLVGGINGTTSIVERRSADMGGLSQAIVAGRLDARIDLTRYPGYNVRQLETINGILDALMAPMTEAAGVLDLLARRDLRARVKGDYPGDHARFKNSVNATAEALHEAGRRTDRRLQPVGRRRRLAAGHLARRDVLQPRPDLVDHPAERR